jgi:hypothetical protein
MAPVAPLSSEHKTVKDIRWMANTMHQLLETFNVLRSHLFIKCQLYQLIKNKKKWLKLYSSYVLGTDLDYNTVVDLHGMCMTRAEDPLAATGPSVHCNSFLLC